MKRSVFLLTLALLLPLGLYFVPYAYASTQSTYVVLHVGVAPDAVDVLCSSSTDFSLHYTFFRGEPGTASLQSARPTTSAGLIASTGDIPNGWVVIVGGTGVYDFWIFCQSQITVAGIGVPEFGSLYTAIALGAVVFFLLSRYMSGKRPISVPAPL